MTSRKVHILVGATGSVASIKIPLLVKLFLQDENVEVKVVPTVAASHFFESENVLSSGVEVFTDTDEWKMWSKKTDPVLHIDLRNWADIMILAPLDANTLAKIANGMCDNLLTCILRAWDPSRPVVACPAMNTNMWEHSFTAKHLSVLTDTLGFRVVAPISKLLACGDLGVGAMAEPETIVKYTQQVLEETRVVREARMADDVGGDV